MGGFIMDSSAPSGRRLWRREDRAKTTIFQVFRSAYLENDARRANKGREDGELEISLRAKQRREGVSEDVLRAHLEADLSALLNTIELEAAVSLEDSPHIRKSILNYGFRDLSSISPAELNTSGMVDSIRRSLLNHEPRLVPETLQVRILEADGSTGQRLSIAVEAELMSDPVDIPIDFDAEVDLGAGKLKMSNLKVQK